MLLGSSDIVSCLAQCVRNRFVVGAILVSLLDGIQRIKHWLSQSWPCHAYSVRTSWPISVPAMAHTGTTKCNARIALVAMAQVKDADGNERHVEEHEIGVRKDIAVSPNSSRTHIEVYDVQDAVSEDFAESIWNNHTVNVEDHGVDVIDLTDEEITVL